MPSETFGRVPNDSEAFGNIRNTSEPFRNVPKPSERKEYCTLTVREVARLFEEAGVARTERSIINWCQLNKMGIARLENYFDPNERKYFISPKSVDQVIQEEIAKAAKVGDPSTRQEGLPKGSETEKPMAEASSEADPGRLRELEKEILDLKITNRGKDYFIEQLQKEREEFVDERAGYVEKLMSFNRKVGELESKLLGLEGPEDNWCRIKFSPLLLFGLQANQQVHGETLLPRRYAPHCRERRTRPARRHSRHRPELFARKCLFTIPAWPQPPNQSHHCSNAQPHPSVR